MTTANERDDKAWNDYLVLMTRDSKSKLTPFLKAQHVYVRGMQKWMSGKGLSVQAAKQPSGSARRSQRECLRTIKLKLRTRCFFQSW